jgi:hypothetical protein
VPPPPTSLATSSISKRVVEPTSSSAPRLSSTTYVSNEVDRLGDSELVATRVDDPVYL